MDKEIVNRNETRERNWRTEQTLREAYDLLRLHSQTDLRSNARIVTYNSQNAFKVLDQITIF